MATTYREVVRGVRERLKGDKDQQEFLREAAEMGDKRVRNYGRFESYYEGDHKVQLTDREREYLEASGFRYAENFCEPIVDIFSSRQKVTGFGSASDSMAAFAKELWTENRADGKQIEIHNGATKLGDYFVIVEPNADGLPSICPNHPGSVKVVYDSGEAAYAVKVWNTRRQSPSNPEGYAITRMNIYWPNSIEKWFSADEGGETWAAFRETDEAEGNTNFWTMDGTPDGEPIGINVIHFAHKPNHTGYGRSRIRGAVPQQDALNKSLIDLFWVMDAQGWPQQYGTGMTANGIKRHPGSLMTVESDTAKFGQFAPADPKGANAHIESQIGRIASRSNSPLHLLFAGGNLPSGETLKTSESGLVQDSEDFHVSAGNRWEDVVHIAARIQKAFGPSDKDVSLEDRVETRWARAASRQELDEANTAVLWTGLGVSQDTTLSRLGFDPAEEREKRKKDEPLVVANDLLTKAQQMQQSETPPQGTGGKQPAEGKPGRNAARTR